MTPSERVRAIAEISKRLELHDWFLIDLCLSEFGVPTEDNWSGGSRAYVVQMLRRAPDETVASLAEHVGFHAGSPQPPPMEPEFWSPGYFKLFISHTHQQAGFASRLQKGLRRYAISGFIAHKDIEPSTEWVTAIELALSTCDALTALLTPDFHASNWTDQEIGFALGRSRLVVPVAMPLIPYGFVQRIQAVRGGVDDADALALELFQRLRRNKLCSGRMESAVVHRFTNSESFDEARSNLDFLRYLKRLNRDSSARLIQAIEDNPQLKDAEHKGRPIPELVRALVRERGEEPTVLEVSPDDDIPF